MKLIKENQKWKTYQTDEFKICYRHKDSISGDNEINPKETIHFISGSAEITLKKKTRIIKSPETIEFPAKTYHKIRALTDIYFILIDK